MIVSNDGPPTRPNIVRVLLGIAIVSALFGVVFITSYWIRQQFPRTTTHAPAAPDSEMAPMLISPRDTVRISDTDILFEWKAVPGITDYVLVVERQLSDGTMRLIPFHAQGDRICVAKMPNGRYFWHVIPIRDSAISKYQFDIVQHAGAP